MIRVSYLQIYNEVISDLLKNSRTNLQIREDKNKGVFVEGLTEWAVRNPSEIYSLMTKGTQCRATASTKLNDLSSRSHAVFIIIIEQMTSSCDLEGTESLGSHKQIKVGKLNLVDLAGSERLSVTGATGQRLEECKKINLSLSALGNVIAALTDQKNRIHVPYRDSKLTRLLEDSLGGNCKTTMMAMISPSYSSFSESLSTLKFANRAKNIKNNAKINEDVDDRALLRKYEAELKSLRKQLEEKDKDVLNKELLFKLEEDKKRAEEDKAAAIIALETRSREYMKEKNEKRKLEEKIKSMSSQMLIGGQKIEDTPQFLNALEEKQKIIRQEYEEKFQELEREREQIEENKAQADKYKQLLLKQRDIMIALTARLNERDETILQLQEELDAYDRIHKETEDLLDKKCMRNELLTNLLKSNSVDIPPDDDEQNTFLESMQMLHRRYPPDTLNCTGPYSETPLTLLTSEEKIAELSEIIQQQQTIINDLNREQNNSTKESQADDTKKKNDLLKESEKFLEEREKLVKLIENEMLVLTDNAIKSLKEQKDQYRLHNITQNILSLQKILVFTLAKYK